MFFQHVGQRNRVHNKKITGITIVWALPLRLGMIFSFPVFLSSSAVGIPRTNLPIAGCLHSYSLYISVLKALFTMLV